MDHEIKPARRRFIGIGCMALTAMPLTIWADRAGATTNDSARSVMKYQNEPSGGKACIGCVQFESGTSGQALGSCKLFPGDTEISPSGYCNAWAAKTG